MQSQTELAILGGRPSFDEARHVGRPNLGDRARFMERVADVWDRRWLTNDGPLLAEFEERVRVLSGAEHCIVVANCTLTPRCNGTPDCAETATPRTAIAGNTKHA